MKTDDVYTPFTFSVQNAEPEVSSVFSCSCCSYLCDCMRLASSSMSFVKLHSFLRALTVLSFLRHKYKQRECLQLNSFAVLCSCCG
jgi:hypothetical protein